MPGIWTKAQVAPRNMHFRVSLPGDAQTHLLIPLGGLSPEYMLMQTVI